MKHIQWETFTPFMGGIANGEDLIGLSTNHYFELKLLRRVETVGRISYRFSYYILKMKKIGEHQPKIVPIMFPVQLEEVRRTTTTQGIKYEHVANAEIELLENNTRAFTSSSADYRIIHRKLYHHLEREELFQDIEDALIRYGYIHGLKKFQKLED